MKKYAIWNKKDDIFTPSGRVYSPEQWIDKHPAAGYDSATVVCAAGVINGAIFGILEHMVKQAEAQGCDFSNCTTNEERLEAIEAFEDEINTPSGVSNEEITADALASIAASLEYQNMMSLDDAEVE